MDSRVEARLIELSRMSTEARLQVSQDSDEVQGYLQTLEYLSSIDPPAPSQTKMWAGHARLMAGLEDSRPAPLLTRLFGRGALFVRTAPIALAAAAVIATASSAAVITDAAGSRAAFSEVLSTLGIHEPKEEPVNESAPALTPTAAPPESPINSRPGAFEEPWLEEDAPQRDPAAESNEKETQEVTPADQQNGGVGQGGTPPGRGGANPGNGVGQEGTPPGQGGANPGNGVGQGGTPPGQGGANPGNGVGQGGTPPGQGGANPGNGVGQSGTPPGQGGANHGNDVGQEGTPPGQGGVNPGNGVGQESTPPGQGGESPGNGQSKKP